MSEPEVDQRRERMWLAAGAMAGVLVAGALLAVFLVLGNADGANPVSPPVSTPPPNPAVLVRDESLRAAEEAAAVLNTLDHRSVQEGLDRWESMATTPLVEELRARRADAAATVTSARTATSARVLASAVARVAADNSGTEVLVAVEVTVTEGGKPPQVKQVRVKLGMLQTGAGWKASSITVVEPAG